MTVTADALDMLAGDPARTRQPGDFHRHPTTGAPYVNHPTDKTKDGKPRRVMYGRPSSFGSALDNPFNLLKWKERKLLAGIVLLLKLGVVLDVDPDDRDTLDALIAYAYELAETDLSAKRGTHVHLLCERADTTGEWSEKLIAEGEAIGIPRALQEQIVTQWRAFRARMGLTAVAVEQTVVNDRWRLAGTLDRLDVADRDILTAYGVLEAGVPFVGDIKTGGLSVGSDGQPNYWVKYPVQLAAYVDAVPYDTETDERGDTIIPCQECDDSPGCGHSSVKARPNPHIALIYHYDLARALAGEVVDWQAIPVNVDAGREGGDLCRAAADFAKRRDLFAMPAPSTATISTNVDRVSLPSGSLVDQAEDVGANGEQSPTASSADIAVPTLPVAVEQPAVAPGSDTASPPVPVSAAPRQVMQAGQAVAHAATRDRLISRVKDLVDAGHEHLIRAHWPDDVPTLKHCGHTPDELNQILVACRQVETIVGAPFHPDDGPPPQSRDAARKALAAWGDDINGCWFAASLIATFEQCRLPDCTLDGLVAEFSIEQAQRLYDAAPSGAITNHPSQRTNPT